MKERTKLFLTTAKSSFEFISKIYNPFAVLFSIIFFLILCFFPIKFVPDYFSLRSIENLRTFVWSLFTISLGFSGLILTVLLVAYNFYIKSTRRNTFDFIIENPWLKTIFSFFACSVSLNILGFLLLGFGRERIEIPYFLLISTFIYIISLFPLTILSLKYSTSIARIKKITNAIDKSDILYLSNPDLFQKEKPFESIESNRIIILKDIGVNAIKDGDWMLPQKILNDLFVFVKYSFDKKNEPEINRSVYCFIFVCNHFFRVALKNSDHITVGVVYSNVLAIYSLLIEKKHKTLPHSNLDFFLKELCFSVIDSKDFPNIRDHMVNNICEVLEQNFSSLSYTDNELPTLSYHFDKKYNNNSEGNPEAVRYWHYLIHTHIDLLIDIIKYSITKKDERVYDHFNWNIDSFIRSSPINKSLTAFQYDTLVQEFIYKLENLVFFAIDNGQYENLDVFSHITIGSWINENKIKVYERGLFFYSRILKKLLKNSKMDYILLDNFFMIGRETFHKKIDEKSKEFVIALIFETSITLYKKRFESYRFQYELQRQIQWLYSYFDELQKPLPEIKLKYEKEIQLIISDYEQSKYPDLID